MWRPEPLHRPGVRRGGSALGGAEAVFGGGRWGLVAAVGPRPRGTWRCPRPGRCRWTAWPSRDGSPGRCRPRARPTAAASSSAPAGSPRAPSGEGTPARKEEEEERLPASAPVPAWVRAPVPASAGAAMPRLPEPAARPASAGRSWRAPTTGCEPASPRGSRDRRAVRATILHAGCDGSRAWTLTRLDETGLCCHGGQAMTQHTVLLLT